MSSSPASLSSSPASLIPSPASRPPTPLTLFEDALFTLFHHTQPARGNPGDTRTFHHPSLPSRTAPRQHPTQPRSIRYRICQNDGLNNKLFAHHQWDSGLYLAQLIADHCSSPAHPEPSNPPLSTPLPKLANQLRALDVRAKTVVELGAGTGLPGFVAALMGARTTVITDYPDHKILANLHANLDLVLGPPASECPPDDAYARARKRTTILPLLWGDEQQTRDVLSLLPDHTGFDVVLASDVLWVSSSHPALVQTIRSLLRRHSGARCVVVAGFHSGRPPVTRFFRSLGEVGIVPDWQEQWEGVWERDADGRCSAWNGVWIPRRGQGGGVVQGAQEDAEEEMGDVAARAGWCVVALLRWADL